MFIPTNCKVIVIEQPIETIIPESVNVPNSPSVSHSSESSLDAKTQPIITVQLYFIKSKKKKLIRLNLIDRKAID